MPEMSSSFSFSKLRGSRKVFEKSMGRIVLRYNEPVASISSFRMHWLFLNSSESFIFLVFSHIIVI